MTQTLRSTVVSGLAALALALGLALTAVGPAEAQTRQDGLVNVNISDVLVQVPIGIAANLCRTSVNLLSEQLALGDTGCDAVADSSATGPRGNGGNTRQSGLVNVNAQDITVQAPIGIAANICDTSANVLARQAAVGDAECDAVSNVSAE